VLREGPQVDYSCVVPLSHFVLQDDVEDGIGSISVSVFFSVFYYVLLFYNLLEIQRVISKGDENIILKQVPSSDGPLELI
jgi:hypothetical protein